MQEDAWRDVEDENWSVVVMSDDGDNAWNKE